MNGEILEVEVRLELVGTSEEAEELGKGEGEISRASNHLVGRLGGEEANEEKEEEEEEEIEKENEKEKEEDLELLPDLVWHGLGRGVVPQGSLLHSLELLRGVDFDVDLGRAKVLEEEGG